MKISKNIWQKSISSYDKRYVSKILFHDAQFEVQYWSVKINLDLSSENKVELSKFKAHFGL